MTETPDAVEVADDGNCPTCGRPLDGMSAAVASGDELTLLLAIRDRLLLAIEDCPMRDLSPLTRRLQDVMKEIRDLQERRAKSGGAVTQKAGEPSGDSASQTWNADDI